MKYRINLFEQLSRFFEIVFSGKHDLNPSHISLYLFLLNQNNRCNWSEWFKCSFDIAMQGSGINGRQTYYKIIKDLAAYGLIEYTPGINRMKSSKFSIIKLTKNKQQHVPLSEQAGEQVDDQQAIQLDRLLHVLLPNLLGVTRYRLLTDNLITIITNNQERIKNTPFYFKIIFEEKEKQTDIRNQENPEVTKVQDLFREWLGVLKKIGSPKKTQESIDKTYEYMIKLSGGNVFNAQRILEHAIRKENKDLYKIN